MAKPSKKFSPKLLIIIVAVLAVLGVGAFVMMGKNPIQDSVMNGGSNAFTSIRDALSKSVSLECEMTDTEGRITKAYIKNGAVRADMTDPNPENSGSMIMKDRKFYMWNGNEGFVMELPDEDYDSSDYQDSGESQADDFLNDLEEYKDSCKPAVVSDSIFTPPSDVNFVNMSSMMGGNGNGSGEMTEEELKNLMEVYQDQ